MNKHIQKKVFWVTAHLLNLTVDMIFFDTINTYFEMEDPGDSDLLEYGKSKHKIDDLTWSPSGWPLPGRYPCPVIGAARQPE